VHGDHRSNRWLCPLTSGVEAFVAVMAVYGGIVLVTDPQLWQLDVGWLHRTPLRSWTIPGLLLMAVVAVPMAVAAVLTWRRSVNAGRASTIAGAALVGWIVLQVAIIGLRMLLQPLLLIVGLFVVGAGIRIHHESSSLAPR